MTVVIAAPEMHRAAIEREGLAYAAMRPCLADVCAALNVDVAGAYRVMLSNPHFILDEIYMRFLRETYEDVVRAAAGADVIATDSLLVGAHLASEKLALPSARVALAPLHLQSAASPSVTPSAPYLVEPRFAPAVQFNRLVRTVVRGSGSLRMRRLHALRRTLGLPRTREDLFLDFGRDNSAGRIFGLYSPRFSPAQPDQPRNLEVVGFPFSTPRDATRRSLDAGLLSFLAAGAPPIVFTLGSFVPEVSGDFYDVSIRAARALGRRAVLLAGARDAARLAKIVGPGELVREHAPHALLFPRSAGVVHHGGVGTTAEALRAGRPQIVVPFFGDQPDHASRIERLGIGVALRLSRYDVRRAIDALSEITRCDYATRAARFAAAMSTERGVEAVADWVERAGGRDEAAA